MVLGRLVLGRLVLGRRWAAIAVAIRAGVQNARAARCAALLTACRIPMAGPGADPPGRAAGAAGRAAGAAGWPPVTTAADASSDTATTREMAWGTYHC